MSRYLLRRAGFAILTLLLTSLIILAITQFIPGDVARVILGREAGEAALEAFRETYGLNDPILVQYGRWVWNFLQGDWGESLSLRTPIRDLLLSRMRNSAILAALTLVLAVPVSLFLGALAGLNENRLPDHLTSILALAFVGLPEFVTGILLIQIFGRWLGWLPTSAAFSPGAPLAEMLPATVLPALTATLVLVAYIARLVRAGVVEELKQPYVRTALLKGLSYRVVVVRHVLRNALLPAITVIAISLGWLMGGLIVIENFYNFPGVGRLLLLAIDRRDIPLMQAIAMVTVLAYTLANLAADLMYAWLNPRVRLD